MGRGRTTTGMIAATLIATIAKVDMILESTADMEEDDDEPDQGMAAEAEQYLNGQSGQSVSL
jgi:hypothetical protein